MPQWWRCCEQHENMLRGRHVQLTFYGKSTYIANADLQD